jgi:hypothetical protein
MVWKKEAFELEYQEKAQIGIEIKLAPERINTINNIQVIIQLHKENINKIKTICLKTDMII